MNKYFLSAITAFGLMGGSLSAHEAKQEAKETLIGVVNFATCVTESKLGKKEQENAETIRKQMASMIEETEKEIQEISAKFEDTEYLDSLSPKAEEELKVKFQTLQEQHARYQNQYYQVANQIQYQMLQKMSGFISEAAEKVAQEKHLDYVMNKEACFFIRSDLDVTPLVIDELNHKFDELQLKKLSSVPEAPAQEDATQAKAG